jgi:hypothetical protein
VNPVTPAEKVWAEVETFTLEATSTLAALTPASQTKEVFNRTEQNPAIPRHKTSENAARVSIVTQDNLNHSFSQFD